MGPLRVEWQEGFGEWVENHFMRQVREFSVGPFKTMGLEVRLSEESGGVLADDEISGSRDAILGGILVRGGVLKKSTDAVIEALENRIATLKHPEDAASIPPRRN